MMMMRQPEPKRQIQNLAVCCSLLPLIGVRVRCRNTSFLAADLLFIEYEQYEVKRYCDHIDLEEEEKKSDNPSGRKLAVACSTRNDQPNPCTK